jgi:2-polyprenyl-6-methoxyphenol hydroxylase-like FAD-dependent oxidoreductase
MQCTALLQATKAPFINAIFDREPLERWVFGRVVLAGEAAHPTTPHALRSTNMAIADAGGCQMDDSQQHSLPM